MRTKHKATKEMGDCSLPLKYELAVDGRLWKIRTLVHQLYMCAKHGLSPRDLEGKLCQKTGWSFIAPHVKKAFERKDGSVFRDMADAFEMDGPRDKIRAHVFRALLDGKLPTQAALRAELIAMGFPDNDGLRKTISRACKDSGRLVPKGKPGPRPKL